MPSKIPVYILAGGKSSRFGSDKARAPIHGTPLIRVLAERLSPFASTLTVVADVAGKYDDLGLNTIADQVSGLGPIGGLKTILSSRSKNSRSPWFLLVSCDLAALDPAWLKLLLTARKPRGKAVAFKGERWEPLFGLYHSSIRDDVELAIRSGEHSMWKLLERVRATAVPLPPDWPSVAQINSPDDLAKFLQRSKGTKKMPVKGKQTKSKLPGTFKEFISRYPVLGKAHEQVAKAVESAGPLDGKTCSLIKIGICVGAGLESATRSHVRRAMEHGASKTEVEQAILLAMNTVGFPKTVAAWSWAQQQFERGV